MMAQDWNGSRWPGLRALTAKGKRKESGSSPCRSRLPTSSLPAPRPKFSKKLSKSPWFFVLLFRPGPQAIPQKKSIKKSTNHTTKKAQNKSQITPQKKAQKTITNHSTKIAQKTQIISQKKAQKSTNQKHKLRGHAQKITRSYHNSEDNIAPKKHKPNHQKNTKNHEDNVSQKKHKKTHKSYRRTT